jgi:transposase
MRDVTDDAALLQIHRPAAESAMLGPPKTPRRDELVLTSLERRLPASNFYRHLDAKLDLSFVRDWVGDKYAERGRRSIDPVVFFRLQLIMFFEGIRSERKLIETADLHVAHRWYLGYGFDEPLPDHSSLTRIRSRLGLTVFTRFFARVVELCQEAGLVWGKELLFDATKVRANADVDSLVPRFYQRAKEHLDELFVGEAQQSGAPAAAAAPAEADEQLDTAPSQADAVAEPAASPALDGAPTPTALPFAGTPEEEQQLAAANEAHWRLLDKHRLDPTRPPSNGYRRTTDCRVSTTDPDATPMSKGGETKLGYHDHYVVDGGKARIILNALVTPADVMENQPMLDLLRRVQFRYHLHPQRAIADTTYGTVENIRALEDAGIRAYVPLPNFDERTPYYGLSKFSYDAEQDVYRCPEGTLLTRRHAKYTEGLVVYRAEATTCNSCPVKAACTASDDGRMVHRSLYAEYLEQVRGYHETEPYQKAMRKRQVWVEPLFGEAKEWHHLQKFRLRGLEKVNIEGQLIAAGQNLKRWLKATGWGRRAVPGEAVLASFAPLFGTRPGCSNLF